MIFPGWAAAGATVLLAWAAVACVPVTPPAPAAPVVPSSMRPSPVTTGLARIHDPGQVTGTEPAHCTSRGGGQLPDRRCTPGSIDPAVTQANIHRTICVSGYTKTVRPPGSQTARFKYDEAYPAYGVLRSTRAELDHLVSLELGGSNDAANLWPEAGPLPNQKDSVEAVLHAAICSGKVTLAAAQKAIAADWMTAEQVLGLAPR